VFGLSTLLACDLVLRISAGAVKRLSPAPAPV
jgi:hypothetical protein